MAKNKKFKHNYGSKKTNISGFKIPLRASSFSSEQISIIWDFYVVRTVSGSSSLSRTIKDYGWDDTRNKISGYPALEKDLMTCSDINEGELCIKRTPSIKKTLSAMDLSGNDICIEHPRAVMMQRYRVDIDENEKPKLNSVESRINSIFRHIRNSLSHGNTYFFDNGMLLLEDKSTDGKQITARIVIKQKTLLDWIKTVDKNEEYYKII